MANVEIPLRIEPEDGDPYAVVAESRDIYQWEKTTPNKDMTIQRVMEEMRFLELYRLGWICARRHGMFSGTLEEFSQACRIEPADDEDGEIAEPDPTPPAPSAGSSSPSPSPPASPRASGRKRAAGRS